MVRYAVSAVYLDPQNNAQNHGGEPMQQATYNNAATGSVTPFISGSLATQGAIDDLAGGFIGTLGAILDELVDEATDELRDAANSDSDWREFALYLRVDLQGGEVSYGYDG